jgi:hypothetical protein
VSVPPARLFVVLACAGVVTAVAAAAPPNVPVASGGGALEGVRIAVDPGSSKRLVAVYWDDQRDLRGTCSIAVSYNRGATWTSHAFAGLPGTILCLNPAVAFGRNRMLYIAYEAARLSGFAQVELVRSTDGGASFGAPVLLDPDAVGGGDREPVIVAGKAGRVVVSFQRYSEDEEGATVAVVSSSDGGRTFSAPVAVTPPAENAAGSRAALALDAAGTLYAGWVEGSAVDLDAGGGTAAIVVAASRDGGRTFGPPRTVAEVPGGCGPNADCGNRYPAVSLAASAAGRVVAAWSAGAFPDPARISTARSIDGGRRWSAPKTLAPLSGSEDRDQYDPDASAAPDTRVDLVFLDQARDADNGLLDVEHVHSVDGGRTFSRPVRLDQTPLITQGREAPPAAAVASSNASAAVVWSIGEVFFAARSDSAPPRAPLVRGSLVVREGGRAMYRLSATDGFTPAAALRFLCGVDAAPLRRCPARVALRLPPGPHVLRVRAVDAAGNRSPATRVLVRVSSR